MNPKPGTAKKDGALAAASSHSVDGTYNFGYLDEQTKRMIRRCILKAIAVPGYQVPFGSREMPLPYGWGTGGIQLSASILGPDDTFKVIDQGADDTTNAVSIRQFFARVSGVATTEETEEASVIQTRHRVPEVALRENQILVYQVPQPEPMRPLEPSETETRKMHAYQEYGLMHVRLYDDVAKFGEIAVAYAYPVLVNGRHLMSPSPIPKYDNPKMHEMAAIQIFSAGREKRIYAIPPYTEVKSLDFDDYPFDVAGADGCCGLCGAEDSFLVEVVLDNDNNRMFVCSDTAYCNNRQAKGHFGPMHARAAE
jgi:alpha-D-ribose 1-methylphosphonate 5-phosphate C-P lyase